MNLIEKIFNYTHNYNFSDEYFIELEEQITNFHFNNCKEYKSILKKVFKKETGVFNIQDLYQLPFIHVNMFKNYNLKSIRDDEIFKTLNSSGTTSQKKSSIFLSRENSRIQAIALSKIFTDFTGLKRPRIVIIDSPDLMNKSLMFSARSAGIRGFSSLCRKPTFILNNDMSLNYDSIERLIENNDEKILLYGFTFIIWLHLLKHSLPKHIKDFFMKKGVLLHGGGWKKLENLKISKNEFRDIVFKKTGIQKIINYYGMVEQTGSIFMECEHGFLHSNPLCNIISRSINNLEKNEIGEIGLAQIISCLPLSYPGHSLLTDDLISINSLNSCSCGRKGTSFNFVSRLDKSESRGCSDTYEN